MSSRGKTLKYDTPATLTLLRPMITRRYELAADHETCCGCRICATVCPREAITVTPGQVAEGRMAVRPRIDIDAALCSFCGECVALCPTHALALTVNGEPEVPVVKGGAFPELVRSVAVNVEICRVHPEVDYAALCPAEVIHNGEAARNHNGDVTVDEAGCMHCTHCMEEGPAGAFTVVKPYQGRAFLDTALCPAGCQACADVCPSDAITYDGDKVAVDRRFCLFCGACENVCPAEGAIRIVRSSIAHTPIESGAWAVALDRLVSFQEVVREYDVKGQRKRRRLVVDVLLPESQEAAGES